MKARTIILIFAAAIAAASCSYDDSELRNRIDSLDSRVTALEKDIKEINSDIESMHSLLVKMNNNIGISSISSSTEGSGIVITTTDGNVYNITDGKDGTDSPVIGIRKGEDGTGLYWVCEYPDGHFSYFTDDEGKPLSAETVVPTIRLEGNHWQLSYNGGQSWSDITDGQGNPVDVSGDCYALVAGVEVTGEDKVTITLSNGEKLDFPYLCELLFEVEADGIQTFGYSQTRSYHVTARNVSSYVLNVPGGWKASYIAGGSLSITAPAESNEYAEKEGKIDVIIFARNGLASMFTLEVSVGL